MHSYKNEGYSENAHRIAQRQAILDEINIIKSDIDAAQTNFNMVYEPSEVDIYIYKLRTAQAQYDSLLKKLKDLT